MRHVAPSSVCGSTPPLMVKIDDLRKRSDDWTSNEMAVAEIGKRGSDDEAALTASKKADAT